MPARALDTSVTAAAQRVIGAAGDGSLRPRHAKQLRKIMEEVAPVVDNFVRIAERGNQLARSSAQLAHDVEQLATAVDDFATKRAETR
ncbi:MAG: hypothetical protein JO197_09650 [Acidobacteria bacterium]|nr:hypothetical protein [Acidobacteriota bacterium]MBV9477360.1 hypothetical protein [Acidobacteriota bacterium]